MAKPRIKIDNDGLYDLRRDPGVIADLERRMENFKQACGAGYESSSQQGQRKPQGRWRTTLITANSRAMRDNARNNTMVRNLGAMGLQ